MERRARVAVVLLNYGEYAEKYLESCYDSLKRQTYPQDLFRVFVVNNGVTEKTRALIARLAPEARLLENADNLGWSGGNNRAVKVALDEGFDYLVMLNIDTVVDEDWLTCLVDAANGSTGSQIFQSKILLEGTTKINSLGNRIQYLGYGYCLGYGQEDSETVRVPTIDYASGAAMLVKREVFEKIGFFREDYFMYYDDMEFCWRARIAGFRIEFVEPSVCHHKYDFKIDPDMFYYRQRNRMLTLLTLERLGTIVVIAPCLMVSEVVVWIYCLGRGWGRVSWDLLRYFLRRETWRSIVARRREVRSIRTKKDATIVKQFSARIVFAEIDSPALKYIFNPLLWLYWTVARRLIVW